MFSKPLIFISALLLSTLFIFSCDDDTLTIKNTHRIKQAIINYSDINLKSVYSYSGEKLDSVLQYQKAYSDWVLSYKTIITYNKNKIVVKGYSHDEDWISTSEIEFIYNNGLLSEMYNYDYYYDYTFNKKIVFSYSGKKCVLAEYSEQIANDSWEPYRKNELIYENEQLVESKSFYWENGAWDQNHKELFLQENGKIVEWIAYLYYYDVWEKDYKVVYSYSGENIIMNTEYYWDENNSDWVSEELTEYEYDEYNNLTALHSDWNDCEYIYEEGNGNISLFIDPISKRLDQPSIHKSTKKKENIFIEQVRIKYFGCSK